MTKLHDPITVGTSGAAFWQTSDGEDLAEQVPPHGLTREEAHTLLGAFPCCFLYNQGETRRDGKVSPGKDPIGGGWQKSPQKPRAYAGRGIGVICGPVPGFDARPVYALDFDIRQDEPAQAMRDWLTAWLADNGKQGTTLVRVGKAPKFLVPFVLADNARLKKYTGECFYPAWLDILTDDEKTQLEILGAANQFVAYHLHPDTGKPYTWDAFGEAGFLDQLHMVTPDDLLELTHDDLEEIKEAFGRIMRENGLEGAGAPRKKGAGAQAGGAIEYALEGFHASVNRTARRNYPAWVPLLFPSATEALGGYRVTSADLGRNLEEDLSFHPDGIKDFGTGAGHTAIGIMMRYGVDIRAQQSANNAAFALCDAMSIKPETLGWQSRPGDALEEWRGTAASFEELLAKAKGLDSTADPAAINAVAEAAATLDKIGQGMVVKAIAKATGLSVVDIRAAVKAAARGQKPTKKGGRGRHQPMPPEMFPDIIWGEGGAYKVLQTIPNVAAMLDYYGIHVTYDVIAKKVKVTVPGSSGAPDNVDNSALSTVISLAKLNEIPVDQVPAFVAVIADERQENPIADWITSKEWDGRDRLPELYNTLEVADGYPLAMRDLLMRRWLISGAAAALKPRGFHTRGVLTLQGAQSIGKSQWLRSLIDDELLRERLIKIDHLLDPANKDSVLGAITHWLVELGELDGSFRKADIARIKGFITADMDRVRRPYDKLESEYQRRTVFFASVNDAQFLVDDTGNSRFWTIAAESVNYDHGIDMQQLWAQVAELWRSGEQWWLTKEEEARLEEINRGHRAASSIRELLDTRLAWDTDPTAWRKKTASEVLISIGYDKPTNAQAREAGAALRERGCTETKTRGVTKFLVPDLVLTSFAGFLDSSE